jgi:hypothetical protein
MRSDPARAAPFLNLVAADVVGMVRRMPPHLRCPIVALTYLFNLSSILPYRKTFRVLGPIDRGKRLQKWRISRWSVFSRLVGFYESLVVLNLYSYPDVVAWASTQTAVD